jgi:hypothetical protein
MMYENFANGLGQMGYEREAERRYDRGVLEDEIWQGGCGCTTYTHDRSESTSILNSRGV